MEFLKRVILAQTKSVAENRIGANRQAELVTPSSSSSLLIVCSCWQDALVEAAVGEEKRRIEEQRELMEKSTEEIQEGFKKRETVLEASHQPSSIAHECCSL